jgi:hypothetical protein
MAITLSGDGIARANLAADVIDSTKLADDAVNSEHLADGSIDAVHLSANSIDSDAYVDASIDNAHLADDAVGVAELSATGTASNSTYLRGDNTWATVTSVGGGTGVDFNDNVKARFGTGNDLEIYHDGSHTRIADVGTGNLLLSSGQVAMQNQAQTETMFRAYEDGGVLLYYNNDKKFETNSTGVAVQTGIKMEGGSATYIDFEDVNTVTMQNFTNSNDLRWKERSGNNHRMELSDSGTLTIDGSFSTSGVDYAEFFESTDGNAIAVGSSVVLENGKVKLCPEGEIPIGVVRPNNSSSTVGGEHIFRWQGKYRRDDYGDWLTETANFYAWKADGVHQQYFEDEMPEGVTPPEGAQLSVKTRHLLNPEYDAAQEENYKARKDRPEWNVIGLLGQIQITKGQPTATAWIKMRDISETVEMWFVK